MKITIFGATGQVGSRAVAEALQRGHEVTAVVRSPARINELPADAIPHVGDASDAEQVAALSLGQDVVISATRPSVGRESDLVVTAEALMEGLRRTGVRILLVGGAGSLRVPDIDGRLVIDDPRYVEPPWRSIAQACSDQYELCLAESGVDWAYISPPALLLSGVRTGEYRLGKDELLVDANGVSKISIEDLAVALLDEAEEPRHHRARFTVAEKRRPARARTASQGN